MRIHIQVNSIDRKEPNKQSTQGNKPVHVAKDDERPPNRLDFAPPPQKALDSCFQTTLRLYVICSIRIII